MVKQMLRVMSRSGKLRDASRKRVFNKYKAKSAMLGAGEKGRDRSLI